MTKKKPRIYFIAAAPIGYSPGQRFRFEHFLPYLTEKGYDFHLSAYLSKTNRDVLYKSPSILKKLLAITSGTIKRIGDLFRILNYDYVYIYREAAPVGPPIFEWLVAKMLRKKIVYDFDDAIWVPTMSEHNRKFKFVRSFTKIGRICKWSKLVTVGNKYLANYARQFNSNVRVIPTVVNTETVHSTLQNQDTDTPQIGWTGSFTTLVYLDGILPVLQRLQEKFDFTFIVIANRDPQLPLKNYQFIPWRKETETEDLLRFHIGLMPLTDTEISKGKCGFKAIQYMALGIPAVVSPVGVNSEIIEDGVNGFICSSEEEWEKVLERLLTDKSLRSKIGVEARKKIEADYSVLSSRDLFLQNFKES